MFRLAGYTDDEKGELYRYLSSIASKVIYNALDVWGGDIPAIMDVYLTEFAGTPESVSETVFSLPGYLSISLRVLCVLGFMRQLTGRDTYGQAAEKTAGSEWNCWRGRSAG